MIATLWPNSGHLECLLDAGADIYVTDHLDWVALHLLVSYDCAEYLKRFLATPGIDVNMKTDQSCPPCTSAAKFGSTASLTVLLGTPGIRVNEKVDGMTALHIAAMHDNPECIALLLATPGIQIHEQNDAGWTALCLAASHGHSECMKLLIANGAWQKQHLLYKPAIKKEPPEPGKGLARIFHKRAPDLACPLPL